LVSIIAAALVCALCGLFVSPPTRAGSADVFQRWNGGEPPPFTLTDSTGATVALAAERGQIVLVHFFATWCEHCVTELPALNRLVARGNGAVKVVAVSVAEPDRRVRRFFDNKPVNYPVLLDRDRAVAKAWGVSSLPTTIVLDGRLRPRLMAETEFRWDGIDPAMLAAELAVKGDDKASLSDQSPTKSKQSGG
jgi:peroxiredoxin